ncbi:MAG: DNA polymerase domain-containing protein [Candidatus Aenigmatarchaeota archaeon]
MFVQVLDIDYIYTNKPIIRIFGKTENGKAVCIFYDKFLPYFYIKVKDFDKAIEKLKNMNDVKNVCIVEKFNPLGFHEKPDELLKITVSNPQNVPTIKEQVSSFSDEIYEADILFRYRFMVDNGIYGMQWIEVDVEKTKTSTVKVNAFHAKSIMPVEKIGNADLKYLAFDIECLPSDPMKMFDTKKDPIIMISLAFYPEYKGKRTLVLIAKPFNGIDVQSFENEKEMLEAFINIVNDFDPDIITGYNINAFDFPYLMDRLKINELPLNIGRCDKPVMIRDLGATKEVYVTGRIVADPFHILKMDPWVKLIRYDLNTVAKVMLNEQKHDVEYSEMEKLWNGSHDDILRFVEYARKDAELSLRLILEKGLLNKFFELSKISGVLLQDAFGGQTKRVETMLLHEFKKRNFVMPTLPTKTELIKRIREREKKGIKGAVVLEPKKGLHTEGCILVLDFKSLYPSIMRTYNVSPDTLLIGDDYEKYKCIKSPIGAYFIDKSVRDGIFPNILTKLTDERTKTKKLMKTKTGNEKSILNAKQLALKDMANSFYGYCGYIRARLYMIDVANAITAFGRDNLEKTKGLIEKNFDVEVLYADTDSVFLKTKLENLDDAKELGEKISKFVTDNLPGFLELEFEKIYRTFLILTKKRYAGWKFELVNDKWVDEIEMRGIETIRRDWCPLVSDVMNNVINIILKEGDIQKAINEVKDVLEKLRKNEIPLEKLTIIKGITKGINGYKGILPHIELAKKITERSPGEAPKIGDRIGFVIIKGNQMLSKRAEDPKYAKKHGLQIDSDYYINNQVFPPLERIFNAIGVEKSEVFGSGRQASLGDIVNGKKREKKNININHRNTMLEGWEELICEKCNKTYRRMPLRGVCECGGEILFSFRGLTGKKIITNKHSNQ